MFVSWALAVTVLLISQLKVVCWSAALVDEESFERLAFLFRHSVPSKCSLVSIGFFRVVGYVKKQ